MAATWSLVALSALSLAIFVYPYLIYPQVLRLLSKKPVNLKQVELSASILFCAYNEIASLPEKIENLRQLKGARRDLQILAYDDSSSDGTYELMAGASDVLTVYKANVEISVAMMRPPKAIQREMPIYVQPRRRKITKSNDAGTPSSHIRM